MNTWKSYHYKVTYNPLTGICSVSRKGVLAWQHKASFAVYDASEAHAIFQSLLRNEVSEGYGLQIVCDVWADRIIKTSL